MDRQVTDKLKELMAGIFSKYCVVSDEAKDACIRGILQNGRILDLARSKYDMAAHLDQESMVSMFSSGSAIVQKRKKMYVAVAATPADKAVVVSNNPDLQLEFEPSMRVNHSIAYIQRIIETKRALSLLRHDRGHITDVGGNPLFHANAGHDNVHSCMLADNTRDAGRIVRRRLEADFSGNADRLRFCTQGIQNCEVESIEALSMFAVQDIDPVDLVKGLCRKGVEYMVGCFHYDPIIYEQQEGFFPYVRMHFERKKSLRTGKTCISFHFENDSSFDYEHDLQRLLQYSRSWSYRVPETDFVYRYDLTYVSGGIARFTLVRQQRDFLGTASNEVAYRFVDHTNAYRISSWTLDLDSSTDSQFTGYKPIQIDVQSDLFMFLYKFGLSNDTENPDKLFTVDQLRAQARTFNETRTLNGYAFTGRLVLSAVELEQLVVAMYVIVLHDMAVENYIASMQVNSMLGEQSKRVEKQFLSTTGKIVGFSFALPVIFMSSKVSVFFKYVAMLLKSVATTGDMKISWHEIPSFVQLPSMQRYSGPGEPTEFLLDHSFLSVDKVETYVQPQQVRELFNDVLSDEQKARLDLHLKQPYVEEVSVGSVIDPDDEVSGSLSPVVSNATDDSVESDLEWYQRDLDEYLQVKREVLWRRDEAHAIAVENEISAHAGAAVLEHARYNFDTSIAQVSAARDKCSEVYAAAPIGNKIKMYNDSEGLGIKFLKVSGGKVDVPPDETYAFGIDPQSGTHLEIYGSPGNYYVASIFTTLLFVSRDTTLLNGFSIGRNLLKLASKSRICNTHFTLVDAIYGAGKTYEIMQCFKVGDIIVTQTAASRDDILDELGKRLKFRSVDLRKCIRTADSAIMHGLPRADTVYIDEGLMMFPGQIFAIAMMSKASRAFVYGDSAQIPPIDRSTTLGFLTYQGMCRWNSWEFRNITYRSPADVVLVLAKFFKLDRRDLLKTASPVKRSLELKVVHNPQDRAAFNFKDKWTFITILRVDRGSLLLNPTIKDGKKVKASDIKPGESRLLNVGEAQGSTFPNVRICRQFMYGDQLFKSSAQTVVAFSRHILRAEYVTTVPNDPYADLVRQALTFTDAQLESVMVPTPTWLRDKVDALRKL